MKDLKTHDDLIKELLTPQEQAELKTSIDEEVAKYWGGKRAGAGRKPKDESNVLKFQVRVSAKEKEFLKYAREHNLNYDELMEM